MAIAATFDGFVIENPEQQEGQYGRYVDVILKVMLGGREVHFVQGRFYGRKVKLILDYVHGGDYMTMTGAISRITPRDKRDGTKCCHIYLRDAFFTLPQKMGAASVFRPDESKAYNLDETLDLSSPYDDNE